MQGLGVRPARYASGNGRITPGLELALQVQDIERDTQLAGHAAGVVGGIGRAAGALDIRERVGAIVEAHPDAHGLDAGPRHEGGRHRRVHAARHGDEDPLASRARGSRDASPGIAHEPRVPATPARWRSMMVVTSRIAASTSASVVVRPRLRRSAPLASSPGSPMAVSTCDGSVEPVVQAEPVEQHRPCEVERMDEGGAVEATHHDRQRCPAAGPWMAGQLDPVDGKERAASRSRRAATASTVAACSDTTSCQAAAMPTAPATFSVPARRCRSWLPPWTWGRIAVPRRSHITPMPLGTLQLVAGDRDQVHVQDAACRWPATARPGPHRGG